MEKETAVEVDRLISTHPVWMEIDLTALKSNFHEIKRLVGPEIKIIASLKGDAYGLGVVEITRALSNLGIYAIATGSFKDAVSIRKAGIKTKIQMFAGNLPEAIEELLRYDLIPTVYNMATAQAISGVAKAAVPIYIKVDAGLGRLGVPLDEAESFIKKVASLPNIFIEGIYTHLPFYDTAGRDWARSRLKEFDDLLSNLAKAGLRIPVTQSLASSGLITGLKSQCNAVCVGHLLYGGLSRVTPDLADLSSFRPVMKTIKTRLIHIEQHLEEKAIGMGGSQIIKKGSITGVIPVGLYDGYRRPGKGKTAMVLIRGRRVPVLNVTLEYITLNLSGIENHKIGEEIVLIGQSEKERISLEEVAAWQNGSPLDVLMSFGGHLPCIYLDYKADVEA